MQVKNDVPLCLMLYQTGGKVSFSVLIVDDSHFFRQRIKEIINEHPELNVIGAAEHGLEGVRLAQELDPDIITMDYEMPYLDGISAVREIMSRKATPIVMFSSMTYEDAKITLDALDAGAVDFIPKNFTEVSRDSAVLKHKIHEKLISFARNAKPSANALSTRTEKLLNTSSRSLSRDAGVSHTGSPKAKESSIASRTSVLNDNYNTVSSSHNKQAQLDSTARSSINFKGRLKVLIIGASTGGPVAVAEIIAHLPGDFPIPIIVVQHMPSNFTKAFADRLNRGSQLYVKEAENGDNLENGKVVIAPGGKQLMFERGGRTLKIIQGDDRVNYKPCLDITFASAANVIGSGVLGVILTGMGADGCEGARLLKQRGSFIWGQDKDSCVVYGMPAAVANANLTDAVYPIKDMATQLIHKV